MRYKRLISSGVVANVDGGAAGFGAAGGTAVGVEAFDADPMDRIAIQQEKDNLRETSIVFNYSAAARMRLLSFRHRVLQRSPTNSSAAAAVGSE